MQVPDADAQQSRYKFGRALSGQNVETRRRPDYDPIPVRVGSFLLTPSLDLGVGYDTNVFESEDDEESSVFYSIRPEVNFRSEWSRHELDVELSSVTSIFGSQSSENRTDARGRLRGTFDITRDTNVRAFAGYQRRNERRGDPDSQGSLLEEPIQYDKIEAGARVNHRFNRLSVGVAGVYEDFDFEDSRIDRRAALDAPQSPNGAITFGGGEPVLCSNPLVIGDRECSHEDRNRSVVTGIVELGWDFSPGYLAFVRGRYNTRDFDLNADRNADTDIDGDGKIDLVGNEDTNGNGILDVGEDRNGDGNLDFGREDVNNDGVASGGFNRDSDGFDVVAGMRLALTNLLFGEVFAGYTQQSYDDRRLGDVTGIAFGAAVEWYPSELLTVSLDAERRVDDTIAENASGRFDTVIGVGVDYELLRNVILSADGQYLNSDFEGTGRDDDVITAQIGGEYLINRNARARLNYEYRERSSNVAFEEFSKNTVLFSVGLNL